MSKIETILLNSQSSNKNILRLDYSNDTTDNLSLSMVLNHCLPWYKRIWHAIKYIFKYENVKFDYYDKWILSPNDVDLLIEYLYKYKFKNFGPPKTNKEKIEALFSVGNVSNNEELFGIIFERLKLKRKFATDSDNEVIPKNTYTVSYGKNNKACIKQNRFNVTLERKPELGKKYNKYYEEYEWTPFIPPKNTYNI